MPLCVIKHKILDHPDRHQLCQEVHDHSLHFQEEIANRFGQLLKTL